MNALMGHLPKQHIESMHRARHINLLRNVRAAKRRAKVTLVLLGDITGGDVFGFDDIDRIGHGNRMSHECGGILKASGF